MVLETYLRLFQGAVGPEFILMGDNARPYRALLVDEFLESEAVRIFAGWIGHLGLKTSTLL